MQILIATYIFLYEPCIISPCRVTTQRTSGVNTKHQIPAMFRRLISCAKVAQTFNVNATCQYWGHNMQLFSRSFLHVP